MVLNGAILARPRFQQCNVGLSWNLNMQHENLIPTGTKQRKDSFNVRGLMFEILVFGIILVTPALETYFGGQQFGKQAWRPPCRRVATDMGPMVMKVENIVIRLEEEVV